MKALETQRLVLRSFEMGDLEDFFAYAKQEDVGPNAGWKPHTTIDETRAILQRFIEEDEAYAIVEKQSGRVIGSLGLHKPQYRRIEKAVRLGYVLSHEYWGKGYMTEAVLRAIDFAFEEMEMLVMEVAHYPFNDRSRRVIEKCGFRYEGTIRYAVQLPDDRITDLVSYSMTNLEWKASKAREEMN